MADTPPEFDEQAPQSEDDDPTGFKKFAKDNGYIDESIDPTNRFAIKEGKRTSSQTLWQRDYFAHNPSGGFSITAGAAIFDSGLRLVKHGRGNSTAKDDYPKSEMEYVEWDKSEELGDEFRYGLQRIKGQDDSDGAINDLSFRFGSDGEFKAMSIGWIGRLGEESSTTTGFFKTTIDKHLETHTTPFVYKTSEGASLVVEKAGESYQFYLVGPNNEIKHKGLISNSMDIDGVVHDLGLKSLIEHPLQPANGLRGVGLGDGAWRFANFAELASVSVEPANDVFKEEFDKKGFRVLIDKAKKEI